MNPVEWYQHHKKYWMEKKAVQNNIFTVNYELLISDFHNEMDRLADIISFERKAEYINEEKKLGWFAND